jgi:uncharacterized protein (TIGR02246 family)
VEAYEIEGRLAIAELHGSYADAVDRGDLETVAGLFAEDGVLIVHGGRACSGRHGILEFLTESRRTRHASGQGLSIRHHLTSHTMRFLATGRARGSCYFLAIGANGADHWGVYRDEFVVENGEWRYAQRAVTIEGADANGWIGSGSGAVTFTPNG